MKKPGDLEKLKLKYTERIKAEIEGKVEEFNDSSAEYKDFLADFGEENLTFYEKMCKYTGKYVGITPDAKTAEKIEVACEFAYLKLTPAGVYSFAVIAPLLALFIFGVPPIMFLGNSGIFLSLLVLVGVGLLVPLLLKMPFMLSENFRLKASNQMVLSVFYLVTYMRHTSNLERAVQFAAEYLSDPMAHEFKKVLWDVETGEYETVSESIENFLGKWREHNPEFVDAVHLIEGSLLEGSETRRLEILDKSLDVILDETYEGMLHFAHNLQSPITTLHMLGIILPILGLVILPLMLSFMPEVKWYHVAVLYDVFLPIGVFVMGNNILSKRPSGCGETPLKESNKEIQAAKNTNVLFGNFDTKIKPAVFGVTVAAILILMGLSPLFMNAFGMEDFGFGDENELSDCGRQYCFLEYREVEQQSGISSVVKIVGPFGLGASIVSVLVILGIGLGIGFYAKYKSKKLKEIFDRSHKLENEFSSALFQLGNKLGDNLPAEIATLKVAESLPDTSAGNFFKVVSVNIQKLGMSIQDAIFNPNVGAIVYYPSELIESSMKVLIQAAKKGPLIASNALINISRYVKEMHKVEERLEDLMAEVVSSMKSQIGFLTPVISAVVVGITSMIGTILGYLSKSMGAMSETMPAESSQMGMVTEFFKSSMPTFYFQLIVGIYVIEITLILTIMINSIKNGSDPVNRDYLIGKNVIKGTVIYAVLSVIIMLVFNIVAAAVMPSGI